MFTTTPILDSSCHPQPRPTALLSVEDNFMPLSWQMPISKSPLRYAVCVRDENKSYELLHKNKEFALNFLDYDYIEAYDKSGQVHGTNKFELTGLTPKSAKVINSKLIEESYMIYECKIIDILNYGDHDIFISEVVLIHNKKIDKVKPCLFLGKGYYETTSLSPKRVKREKEN